MRDRETIDSELQLLVAVRPVCREQDGRVPSVRLIDALLDERSELTGNRPRYPVGSATVVRQPCRDAPERSSVTPAGAQALQLEPR